MGSILLLLIVIIVAVFAAYTVDQTVSDPQSNRLIKAGIFIVALLFICSKVFGLF